MTARHIFISYSRKDTVIAETVYDRLRAAGLAVWLDQRSIRAGMSYAEEIVRAIEEAGAMVLLLSADANTSKEIHREVKIASDGNMPIIPVRLAEVAYHPALKYHLATTQWVDATGDLERALIELLDTLSRLDLPPAKIPPPVPPVPTLPPAPLVPPVPPVAIPSHQRPTQQDLLVDAICLAFPDAVVKKVNRDDWVDIHIPSLHRSRGTHLALHTTRSGIRFRFYIRDREFVRRLGAALPDLAISSHGVQPDGGRRFESVAEAAAAAIAFVHRLQRHAPSASQTTLPPQPTPQTGSPLDDFTGSRILRCCGQLGIPYAEVLDSPYARRRGWRDGQFKVQYRDGCNGTIGWGTNKQPITPGDTLPYDRDDLLRLLNEIE